MTILESVFEQLEAAELVETAEEYSVGWCNKSRSWFANRKHEGGEFGIETAICCLDRVSLKLSLLKLRTRRYGNLIDVEVSALENVKVQIEQFLLSRHRVAKIQLTEVPQIKML